LLGFVLADVEVTGAAKMTIGFSREIVVAQHAAIFLVK
jgi:hypothetical protein